MSWPTQYRVKVRGPGVMPSRTHPDDAGFDLHCFLEEEPLTLQPGERANVPTGVFMELPPTLFGWITPRSSVLGRGLHVVAGVIDPGYRGELFTRVQNINSTSPTVPGLGVVRINHLERLAQLILLPNIAPTVEMVGGQELAPSARGINGFGSSGR